jgi:hypothetical protein
MIVDHITQYVHEINKNIVRKTNKVIKIIIVYVCMIQIVNMNAELYKKHLNYMKDELFRTYNFQ